jgi:glucokinase
VDVALAVDIGGTKLAAGLVTADGEVLDHRAAPTVALSAAEAAAATPEEIAAAAEALWQRLAAVVDEVRRGDEVVCGVGCGGPMDAEGTTVSPLNIHQWRDFPLRGRLADHLGLAVAVDNDAKALALGEGWQGAARGARDFVAMVVSTGVGGGIVLDGRLLEGAAGNAGHIGHVVVEPDGRPCACGGRGCLEAEASGTAIAAISGRAAVDAPPELRRRTGTLVGRAVGSVANLLDLRLAVVAGSVALGFGEEFFTAAQAELDLRSQISFARGARIVPAGLGAAGPLVGAAAVGWRAGGTAVGTLAG